MKTTILTMTVCILTISPRAWPQSAPDNGRKIEKPINYALLQPDPMVGDWQGDAGAVAQVYKKRDGQYAANLLSAFDTESNLIVVLAGTSSADGEEFSGNGWSGVIKDSKFIIGHGDQTMNLSHVARVSPTLGEKPPTSAVVLFDGNNLDAWAKKAGKDWLKEDGPAKWKIVDGAIEIVPGSDSIITHQKFGDCHLHLEFRTICVPTKSAVFLEARYEVNINESYGQLAGTTSGGLDNTSKDIAPGVRPSLPPLSWQTFDVDFTAPRFDGGGNKTAKATMTVFLNGVKLIDHREMDSPFGAAGRLGEASTGPLMLQDHTTPAQFRNIWLTEK